MTNKRYSQRTQEEFSDNSPYLLEIPQPPRDREASALRPLRRQDRLRDLRGGGRHPALPQHQESHYLTPTDGTEVFYPGKNNMEQHQYVGIIAV